MPNKKSISQKLKNETLKAMESKILELCKAGAKQGFWYIELAEESGQKLPDKVQNALTEKHGLYISFSKSDAGSITKISWQ